jgi:glycosyltransferase involved in cell wall biosynthesis
MSGVSIVFPCLNEEKTLGTCLRRAHEVMAATGRNFELIVADNGSRDGSVAKAQAYGARVVHVRKRGYGAAVSAGLREARFPTAVMLDCDLSYPLEEIPKLLASLDDGRDFVLGNRMGPGLERGAMPALHRHFGTPLLSALIRLLTGLPVYDSNSGLRAVRTQQLRRMGLCSSGMEFASEMLMAAAALRLNYAEIPIRFVKDQRGCRSHLRPLNDGLRHLHSIFRGYLRRHRWREEGGALADPVSF